MTADRTRMLNVPNTLTLLRILAVPFFLSFLAEGSYDTAFVVFVAAGVTDAVDGAIARLTDTRTDLGAHLDPLADKLLLVSSFITLGILGLVPIQLMILVIVRDAVILGGFLLSAAVVGQSMEMAPSVWGKLTTFLQILTVSLVLIDRTSWLSVPARAQVTVFLMTAILTVISGIGYVIDGIRWYNAVGPNGAAPPATQ
jgi:cardiolipin synthase